MQAFKIRVNSEQSHIIQQVLFARGAKLPPGALYKPIDTSFIYYENDRLRRGYFEQVFIEDKRTEITFNQFMQIYGNRRISKTKLLN